jgi:hypothetical protein
MRALAPSSSIPVPSQTRAIVLLAVAGFASQAMVRSADSLLPQIAGDFGVTVGAASIVVSAYTIVHGSMQLVSGPVGALYQSDSEVGLAADYIVEATRRRLAQDLGETRPISSPSFFLSPWLRRRPAPRPVVQKGWIDQRLRFGWFLNFPTMVGNPGTPRTAAWKGFPLR